jgi:hypothetical protein
MFTQFKYFVTKLLKSCSIGTCDVLAALHLYLLFIIVKDNNRFKKIETSLLDNRDV